MTTLAMPSWANSSSRWDELSSHSLADTMADQQEIERAIEQLFEQAMEPGKPLLSLFPQMAIPYVAATAIAMVLGTVGNSIILVAQFLKSRVRTKGFEFQANMAVADLIVTAIADPLCIVAAVGGPDVFNEHAWLCKLTGCLCLTACLSAFISLCTLTLNIFTYICHNPWYGRIFTRNRNIALCVIIWIVAFVLDLPNFLGDEGHGYDHTAHQCMWQRTNNKIYTGFVAVFLLLTPIVLMNLAFGWIFYTVYKSTTSIHPFGEEAHARSRKKIIKKTLTRCRGTFPIVIAFTFCWTPYAISLLADLDNTWPFLIHLWLTFLAHLHSIAPFFTLSLANDRYREAFREIILRKKVKSISVTNGNTISPQRRARQGTLAPQDTTT